MRTSNNYEMNHEGTASSHGAGGCFSLLFFPPISCLLIMAFFLFAAGKTTLASDLDKNVSIKVEQNKQIDQREDKQSGKKAGSISSLFTPEVQYWAKSIVKWSEKYELDPNLAATVMQIESCGDPQAYSGSGAIGLFQVMPFHFHEEDSPFFPATNADRGLAYLRQGMDQLGSVRLALAGYNGGISTAGQGEAYWPDETVRYVYWGINIYKHAKNGRDNSPVLDEWLSSGGASLCAQARQSLSLNQ